MISTLVDLLGSYYASNDFANVEMIARSLNAAVPADLVSLQFLGLVYYRTERVKEAIRVFDKVLRRRKPARRALAGPSSSFRPELSAAGDLSQFDELTEYAELAGFSNSAAALCYKEATRQSPQLARAWYDIGIALGELRNFELAIPAFRNSLKAEPHFADAMLAMGRSALHVQDLATAQEGFSRLRAQQPENDAAYRGLALVYRKRRDFAAARACLARAREKRAIPAPCLTPGCSDARA